MIDYFGLITINKMLTCLKNQLCTHNQSQDMDILKCNKYCLFCFEAIIYVKMEI